MKTKGVVVLAVVSLDAVVMVINVLDTNRVFWNEAGAKKVFADSFYSEVFLRYAGKEGRVLDYGCGYGRCLRLLKEAGMRNLVGVDASSAMVERCQREELGVPVSYIEDVRAPFEGETFDGVVLSTILCCNPLDETIVAIAEEVARLLKQGGVLYLCDFLITPSELYTAKYAAGAEMFCHYGTYQTSEGIVVRHFLPEELREFFPGFEVCWEKTMDFVTMNNNPIRQYHAVLRKG